MIINILDARKALGDFNSELNDDEVILLIEQLESLVNSSYNLLLE